MPTKGFKKKLMLIAAAAVILAFQAASASAISSEDTMYGSFFAAEKQGGGQTQRYSTQNPPKTVNAPSRGGETYALAPGRLDGITIGIDPGHQQFADQTLEPLAPGSDRMKEKMSAGARGVKTDTPEYEINLAVAKKLCPLLENAGATVVMTRTKNDAALSNRARALYMNGSQVDFWIRIHCNFSMEASNKGAGVLTPKSDITAGKGSKSKALGRYVIDEFCRATGAKPLSVEESAVQTGFNWSESPVIALEMGFLSNGVEDVRLCKDSYQNACAAGIFNGIIDYCEDVGIDE